MKELSGWGRAPRSRCAVFRPERRAAVASILATGTRSSYIARGLGRSYGDSAVNADAGVITLERLDRFLGFDPENGELHCEAGVSLGEILNVVLPRGFTLGVTPGTRHVTVGGAIAADVHGKNHHKAGTFSQYVNEFTLLTAGGEVLTCSEEKESDAFWATIGGMGLTGVILTAKLRLLPVETSFLKVDHKRVANLDEALAALKSGEERLPYVVAWIDCLAHGEALGRSVIMCGRHARRDELPERLRENPLPCPRPARLGIPFNFPGFALNRLSVKAFNALYYAKHGDAESRLTDYGSFFYPLDGICNWNRMYGRRGFVQYQAAFPSETSAAGLRELLEKIAASGRASFLAVLKGCGEENNAPLSFPMKGHTLALDIPRGSGLERLLGDLDLIVLRHQGRVYLAKDAALNAASLERMYPRLDQFRKVVRRLDPRGLFSSNQARRVGLKTSATRTAIGSARP